MKSPFLHEDPDWIESRISGGIAWVCLNRPRALNSLSLGMVRRLAQCLEDWADQANVHAVVLYSSSERAYCAGGDIRFFHDMGRVAPTQGSALLEDFFTEEYQLNHSMARYSKPIIALIDGVVMGGGMGIAEPAQRRIVTDQIKMAMPEVNIGLFPDVGGSYFLSRCAGRIGEFLAVTGMSLDAADALYAGFADRVVSRPGLARVRESLEAQSFSSSDAVLQALESACDREAVALDPADAALARHRDLIDQHFSRDGVADILQSLENHSGVGSEWCHETARLMHTRSPLYMAVSLEQIRRGRDLGLADCLRMERNLIRRSFEHGEVIEGVRALVVDKDQKPQWRPSRVADVTQEQVAAIFAPCWPTRAHPLRDLQD